MASSAEVRVWRLVRPCYAPGLDGEGARRVGGRWNSPGCPIVYTARHLSLAVLESFMDLPRAQRSPESVPEMRAICLSLSPSLIENAPDDLDLSDIELARAFGDRWCREQRSLAVAVPSAVVPMEWNVLINPRHPEMPRLCMVDDTSYRFDPRLVHPEAD